MAVEHSPTERIADAHRCPQCQGLGVLAQSFSGGGPVECSLCAGSGVYRWVDGRYIHWSRRINALHITQRRLERRVQQVIDAFLLIIAIGGLLAGAGEAFGILRRYGLDLIAFLDHALTDLSEWRMFFWIGMCAALVLSYRSTRRLERRVGIPAKTRGFLGQMAQDPGMPFEQIRIARNRLEISSTFDQESFRIVEFAWDFAHRSRHSEVRAEHLFLSMLTSTPTVEIATRLGIDLRKLVDQLHRVVAQQPPLDIPTCLSSTVRQILLVAFEEGYRNQRPQVGVPEIFVGLTAVESAVQTILFDLEVDTRKARNVVAWMNMREDLRHRYQHWSRRASRKPKNTMNRAMTARPTRVLDSVSQDLTLAARSGALPPLIDRTNELAQVMRILKRDEGNVLIIGDAGVGKTTIGDGIAQLMAAEDVPDVLKDKRLVSISSGALVAGTGGQGSLEQRMVTIIDEVVKAGNVILFIDDISNIVGTGMGGSENVDAAQILANAMSRGLVKVIAGSTTQDYQTYLINDDAFMRRFQIVKIGEMDTDTAIQVLEAKATSIEYRHKVFLSYDAIEKSVILSQRYIHDRYLPAKAVAILEEAAVYANEKRGDGSVVTGEDVAEVVSQKTDIQLAKIGEEESQKLLNLEERLHERIVGQHEAVELVSNAIRRARAELRDEHRPIVNLLFLGPTGVGKTELAKAVAEVYFGSDEHMIRLDMSEYQEQTSISRLIGAPPGYAGSSAGGHLSEAVRSNPFTLVLLDELEKAHPDILNVFLQVMDDGRLTDGAGRTVDFTNVILIATSNAGSQRIQEGIRNQEKLESIREALLEQELKPYFRPEFLNRFDGVVVFKPLSMDEVIQIAYLMLSKVEKRLTAKGITLKATDEAVEELAQQGFDPQFGARPLRRLLQERVDNALAKFLLTGKLGRRDVAVLEKGGGIRVERAKAVA